MGCIHPSFFFAGAEVKFILASGRDCYSGCICNNTEKTSLSYMSTSIAFISFAKGTRGSDQSEFTFLHLPLKIQTLSAGAGRDRTSQPESNLKCGHNQEMDSSHQVIDNPNATILMMMSSLKCCHNQVIDSDWLKSWTFHFHSANVAQKANSLVLPFS